MHAQLTSEPSVVALDVTDARPDAARARQLRGLISARMLASMDELCRAMSDALDEDFSDVPRRLRSLPRLAPIVFGQHERLKNALLGADVDTALEAIATLRSETLDALRGKHLSITGDIGAAWVGDAMAALYESAEADIGEDYVAISPLPGDALRTATLDIQSTLSMLSRIDREMYEEMRELVTDLVVFGGRNITGASGVSFFGAILLHDVYGGQPALGYYMDHLVHEASHHHLYAALLTDPLVLNDPAEKYSSPIRKDPRPMLGLYHGLFVLGRVIRTFQRGADAQAHPFFGERVPALRRAFDAALGTIEESAQLTPVGRSIVETLVAELRG